MKDCASHVSCHFEQGRPLPSVHEVTPYLSGEVGNQTVGQLSGMDIPDWVHWNVGAGFTYKNATLDVRYSNSDLSNDDCELSQGSRSWCGERVTVSLSLDY